MTILCIPLTDLLMVIISGLLLILSFFVWRINARVSWLTGAMESHSTMMLRIEAKLGVEKEPIKVIWWYPTMQKFPFSGEHGQEAKLNKIYLGIPPKYRSNAKVRFPKISRWLSGAPS